MKDKMSYSEFVALCRGQGKIELTEAEKELVRESRRVLEDILKSNPKTPYYGINTGIGALLGKRIPKNKLREFQENLIMSHACGVGPPLEKDLVRGMMLHMILNLKKGCSGIRLATLELLVKMFNEDIIPAVPQKGSLGASGDLVPQAHIALALIRNGKAKLAAGEAIALLNGTSFMTSILAFLVFQANNLIRVADIAAAMTILVLGGDPQSFDDKAQRLRPHLGQLVTAYRLDNLLKEMSPAQEHQFLQDAYSLRCVPQVHGACLETLIKAEDVVDKEINAFCGNPIILTKEKEPVLIQSSGNFHGQILAQTADNLSIALCTLANISERRIERLLNPRLSGLPPFLAKNSGLNTGLMIAQYTAAALVSENRTLAHPASIDSIPVSAGQEDFVSMGAWAVRKAWEICKNTEYVIAIEILCALQALDFKKSLPKESKLAKIHKIIRKHILFIEKDRVLSEDIEKLYHLIRSGEFLREVRKYEENY